MIPWDYDRVDDKATGLKVRRNRIKGWWQTEVNPSDPSCFNTQSEASLRGIALATGIEKKILERKAANMPPDVYVPSQCDKITRMLTHCMYDSYIGFFEQFKARYPSSVLSAKIDRYAAQIEAVVARDTDTQLFEWRNGLQSLKKFLQTAPNVAPQRENYNGGQQAAPAPSASTFNFLGDSMASTFGNLFNEFGGLGAMGR